MLGSLVVVHFRPIAIVVILQPSRVAFVLMDLPCFAVEAEGGVAVVEQRVMFHHIVDGSSGKLRFARVAKVHDEMSAEIVAESRRDCVGLRDVVWNVVGCCVSVCVVIVVDI